jgi:hypothetical protein
VDQRRKVIPQTGDLAEGAGEHKRWNLFFAL